MGITPDKKPDDNDFDKSYVINVSMEIVGVYKGKDLPLETVLRRRLWKTAEDGGRLTINCFDFKIGKVEEYEEVTQFEDD